MLMVGNREGGIDVVPVESWTPGNWIDQTSVMLTHDPRGFGYFCLFL